MGAQALRVASAGCRPAMMENAITAAAEARSAGHEGTVPKMHSEPPDFVASCGDTKPVRDINMRTRRYTVWGIASAAALFCLTSCSGSVKLGPEAVAGLTPDGTVEMQQVQAAFI